MPDNLPKSKNLIPISEAARVLGVSIDTVRRWDKSGVLHSERPDGKNRYFLIDELEKVKFSKPYSISDAAKHLGISQSTLRRLEARGLVKPDRNSNGERTYDQKSLEKFLHSEYFLTKKQVEAAKSTQTEPSTDEEIHPEPNLKTSSRIPDFLAISTAVFLLLVTMGIGNIKLSTAKNSQPLPSPAILSETKEITPGVPEATSEAKPKTILTVKTDEASSSVNIRQKPATSSAIISQTKDGDTFEFVSKLQDWYEIKLDDGSTGFISAAYVVIEEPNN